MAQIATEKSGIIKQGRPVVLAPQEDSARKVVETIAKDRSAPITIIGEDLHYTSLEHSFSGQTVQLWGSTDQQKMDELIEHPEETSWQPITLKLPLLGYHQVQNAATAYAAIEIARGEGVKISDAAIKEGFASVEWPGRFEIINQEPLIVVDSAHNLDSALKLRLALDDYIGDRKVALIFGASEDKDIKGMFSVLIPRVTHLIATQSTHPRAMLANKLVELAHQFGRSATATLDIGEALTKAVELAKGDEVIIVAGSIFVAAAAREEWFKMTSTPNKQNT
ncbi:Dihydrofolate synthase/folylpolyglutamate synthase [bioreactor metagenome]|uniref:Dihydrofolate synthase/folylpolyglutamate synthase n=1 Tax=bioreactor metagenome TaxID=1076179 RepID=A0A644Z967_9ZZZZ